MIELSNKYQSMYVYDGISQQLEYCADKPGYRCGIYSLSRSYMEELFNATIANILDVNDIKTISSNSNMRNITFENGSQMIFVVVNEPRKASTINGALIDSAISYDVFCKIILPCVKGNFEQVIIMRSSPVSGGDNREEKNS